MDEVLYYTRLFDIYKGVLTEKQVEVFTDYFFENLTLEEIAENHEVSKNAISKSILNIKNILEDYEHKLHVVKYIRELKNEFKNEEDILIRIDKYDSIIL